MSPAEAHHPPMVQFSITAFGAICAGAGVLIIGLMIFIIVLIVRNKREHKRYMADLEERGIAIAQTQKEAKRDPVTRPRAVLRRNTILPFNSKSGWGNLPSVETINPPETPSYLPHYAPPKPIGFVPKLKRLSWPFLGRQASGRGIPMRKIRVPVLSTVIESPKPSPLVPVLSGSLDRSSPRKSQSRRSSEQSLNQHHPAYRNQERESGILDETVKPEFLRRSLTAKPTPKPEIYTRPNRAQSVAKILVSNKPGCKTRFPRPQLHTRSVSTSSQASGKPPEGGLPILPLEIARIKSEARRRSLLSRSPSRQSNSSYESAGSSILATQSSPIMRSSNTRVQKVAKRDFRNSMIVGPRPFRDTLTLHGENKTSQGSIKSSAARFRPATPAPQADAQTEKRSSQLTNSSSLQSLAAKVKTAESVTMSKVSSPSASPFGVRSLTTPKRRSGSSVTAYGSPEDRRKRSSILRDVSGPQGGPTRQLSQASTQASSTRSSNGNAFQFDPVPVSVGKPSALKGSPSARKPGHKRQNCVRLSLTPTIFPGPRSRSPSPAIHDIAEESSQASAEKVPSVGLGFSSTRSLPRPPSTSTFAPDLKFNTTSIRASLTASSPTLSMANFDHGPIGTPIKTRNKSTLPDASQQDTQRMSEGSMFSVPTFSSPCHGLPQPNVMTSPPPMFALSRPSNEYGDDARPYDEMAMVSSEFEVLIDIDSSPRRPLLTDEYGPERPCLVYQTPPAANLPPNFSSTFSPILEEPMANPDTTGYEQLRSADSPPCSPKTIPSDSSSDLRDRAAYNLPIKDAAIPEEPLETIDPTILSKDAFTSLNSPFDNRSGSIKKSALNNRNSIPMPTSPTAVYLMQPLLDAAFPSSPPTIAHDSMIFNPPGLSRQCSPSSMHSSPFPTPSPSFSPLPMAPSSPRPAHAQLPSPTCTPMINFAALPTLTPCGPRGPPARSLRSSIQTLRRMNSDAKQGGKAERRYANLGRDDSIALPGEESWMESLDGYEDEEEGDVDESFGLDEEKGRALVGDWAFDSEEDNSFLSNGTVTETGTHFGKMPLRSTSASSTPTIKGLEKERGAEEPKELTKTESSNLEPSSPVTVTRDRSSSIWEDSEKFWQSTPPHPPANTTITSPNKPTNRFLVLSSSPVSTSSRTNRKRAFEVAKDEPLPYEDTQNQNATGKGAEGKKRNSENGDRSGRYRKRSVLAASTPNPKINVIALSSAGRVGAEGTPGSLYDASGFLRD